LRKNVSICVVNNSSIIRLWTSSKIISFFFYQNYLTMKRNMKKRYLKKVKVNKTRLAIKSVVKDMELTTTMREWFMKIEGIIYHYNSL
jgi:hypothetical protein